jgi:Polysaccharide biosynthesis enzyme WcbI
MRKICVIYANCQGRAINTFLQKHDLFNENYENHLFENYHVIENGLSLPFDLLKKADLFIYQPLKNKHGQYATDTIKNYLPAVCKKISFPYIYNDALWPLYEEDDKIGGEEIILNLIEKGYSLKRIINMFCTEAIDFEFGRRFKKSMEILKQKEKVTDLKVSDYILKNISKEKIFLTENHQTSTFYIYCTNQILKHLGFSAMDSSKHFHPNEAGLPDCWPQSPYEAKYYKYEYPLDWKTFYPEKVDSNWHKFHIKIIGKIYLRKHPSLALSLTSKLYLRYRVQLSLLMGDGYLHN